MNRNLYLKYEWKRLFWPVVLGLAGVFLQLGVLFRQIVLGLSQGDGVFDWNYTGTVFNFMDYNAEFTSGVHTFIYQVASSVNMIPFVLFVLFLVAVQFSDRHSLKRVEFMNSLPVREKDLVGNKLLVGLSCIGGLWVILTGGILAMKAYFKTAIMEEIAYKTNVEKLLANDSMTNLWIFLLSTLVLICMDYLIFAAFHIIVKKNLLANIFSLAFTGAPFLILWFVYGYYKDANDMFSFLYERDETLDQLMDLDLSHLIWGQSFNQIKNVYVVQANTGIWQIATKFMICLGVAAIFFILCMAYGRRDNSKPGKMVNCLPIRWILSWEIGIVIAILVFFVFARVIFALYSLLSEELDILIDQKFYTFINLVVFPVMTFLGAFFSNMLMKIKIREGR